MLRTVRIRRLAVAAMALVILVVSTWGVVRAATVPTTSLQGPPALAVDATEVLAAQGGRMVRSCALGLGMVVGGMMGMAANPLAGATAMSLGMHMALFACF
jgi:hypothetical protein